MKITAIETMHSKPVLLSKNAIAENYHMCVRTVENRIKEILTDQKDRYGDFAVIKHGSLVLVNVLVFTDYICYRDRLRDKNLKKNVPPYNPEEVAKQLGYYNIIETSADSEHIAKELEAQVTEKTKDIFTVISNAFRQMA